jgi:hypothetical protein
VSPVANAAKNRSAAGPGPFGRGVHPATETTEAAVTTTASSQAPIADNPEVLVVIVTDVKKPDRWIVGGAPRPTRYVCENASDERVAPALVAEIDVTQQKSE